MTREMSRMLAKSLWLLALGTLSFGDLAAQEAAKEKSNKQPRQVVADPVVSLEFAGGSLAKFAAALRKAGEDVNIVMPALAREVDLPALTLSQATVESALRSIGAVAGNDFQVRVEALRSPYGKPVYAVSIRQLREPSRSVVQQVEASNRSIRVDVLSLKYLTSTVPGDSTASGQTMKAETILTAVDTGLGIDAGITQPEFRYHEESGLLFVKGTPTQIGLVREIIQNLESDMRRVRNAKEQELARANAAKKAANRTSAKDK